MGKKKIKVKFIDKKKAISFHLVAKADHGGDDSGVEDEDEERAELKAQLKAQRAEQRAEAGLPPLADGEDDEDDDAEDADGGSFIPPRAPDDRMDLMNMAAAAEGVETRAVRLARKALKESNKQKFYLQPNFVPGSDVQIPADFPTEHLYTGAVDRQEEEYWAKEDRRKWELERQAEAPALLPHNYDYEKHLRPISGRGVFMEAKRGDELYDAEHDPRDQAPRAVNKAARAGASSSAAGASSSSTSASASMSLHEEAKETSGDANEQEEDDDDMPPLGDDGEDEAPANPALLASVERLQRKLVRQGRRVKVEKDFVAALEGEDDGAFEQLQDDFVLQAMEGAIDPAAAAAAAEEEEEGEDDEEQYGEYEEYYEDGEEYEEGEEYEDGEEEKDGGARPAKSASAAAAARRRAAAEEDEDEEDEEEEEEDEDDGRPKRPLDAAFDKLLEDEYSDGEIGELDQLAEEDPAALEGHLDLDDLADEIGVDDFVASSSKFKSEGGSLIDKVDPQLQGLTLAKLALVTAGEKSLREIETDISAMLDPPVRDTWDAESILSTYSNLENHPRVLREPRRNKAKQIQPDLNASSGSGSGGARSHAARQHLAAFQAPLPIPERALRQGDADGSQDEEDEEGEDDEEEGGHAGGENKGKARAADETPEEKKARKQAVKLAKREAKGRKKQLKTLYVQETAAAMAKQARLNKANPAGVKKL